MVSGKTERNIEICRRIFAVCLEIGSGADPPGPGGERGVGQKSESLHCRIEL